MKKRLTINMLTSKVFWESMPLIIAEIARREHYLSIFDDKNIPSLDGLLDCDALVDMSAITDVAFYEKLSEKRTERQSSGNDVPLMIDRPEAIMNSMDKRRTHALMPDLVPESYDLDGPDNEKLISKFINDENVIIKD